MQGHKSTYDVYSVKPTRTAVGHHFLSPRETAYYLGGCWMSLWTRQPLSQTYGVRRLRKD